MKRAILIAALGVMTSAASVYGQTGYQPQPRGPIYFGHASTIQEGVARGQADIIRANGESNYWHSLAAINREQARSANLDNRLKAVHTYFQMREANRNYVKAEIGRASPEQIEKMAKMDLPPRTTASQLDPTTGRINWPAALQADYFAEHRERLEELFSQRQQGPAGLGSQTHADVVTIVGEMKAVLAEHVTEWPTSAFVAANSLLKSLAYEARFPADRAVLAANE